MSFRENYCADDEIHNRVVDSAPSLVRKGHLRNGKTVNSVTARALMAGLTSSSLPGSVVVPLVFVFVGLFTVRWGA